MQKRTFVSVCVLVLALSVVGMAAYAPVTAQSGTTVTVSFNDGDTLPQHGCADFMLNRANSTVIPFQISGMTPGTAMTVRTVIRDEASGDLHQYHQVNSTAQVASGPFTVVQYMGSNIGTPVIPLPGAGVDKYAYLYAFGTGWGAYTELTYECDTGLITYVYTESW